MAFEVKLYADFGTGEPWVARVVVGLPELVNAVPAPAQSREDDAVVNFNAGPPGPPVGVSLASSRSSEPSTKKTALKHHEAGR